MMSKIKYNPSLLTTFTVLSLGITIMIAVLLAYLLQDRLVQSALAQEATSVADQVALIVGPMLTASDFDGLTQDRLAALDTQIRNGIISKHIVRVKVWNRNGKLIYSDEKDLIGRTFPIED